jgi:hypothetical protein
LGKKDTDQQANTPDEQNRQGRVDYENASGVTPKLVDKQDGQDDPGGADEGRLDKVEKVGDAHVPPHPPVKPEKKETGELEGDDQPYRPFEAGGMFRRDLSFKTDVVGEVVGKVQ